MTYCSLVTQEIRRFTQEYTAQQITEWFEGLMKEYSRWAGMEIRWEKVRNESLSALAFPFAYREGQRELAVHVYHTICHGRKLFLEAPTGTGKTISAVFPSLKAIGEGKADRLFYFRLII
jgi:CRISPR/Cas system-associated endonuclease/helicase Cas3